MNKQKLEQTLVLIKPDALKNSLTGYVLSQLSEFHTGLRFAGAKIVNVSKMLAEEHYAEHRGKVFYPSLIEYIMGYIHYPEDLWKRRVIALVYNGTNAIEKIRDISGPTNPHIAREIKPGCIRALGTVVPLKDTEGNVIGERMDNLIHASATDVDAEREIKLWFKPNDIPPLMRAYSTEVSDEHYCFKDDKLYTTHEPDSVSLLAPNDVVWKSDLEALHLFHKGLSAPVSIETVAAKYLINDNRGRM
ncbi:MAG TPA: nucleoside-diphosphate kinase [Thermodesulfovibrionales bacterium]|nr:nucleoside-diphosphate kinase [Thermodesulfovibrionales bacterium]